MWFAHFFVALLTAVSGKVVYDQIGYFWHITDFHYDPHFSNYKDVKKGCWRSDIEGGVRNYRKPAGRFGDYNCDSPWELIESAAKVMAARQGDNVEFVLWTGDTLSHSVQHSKGTLQIEYVQNLTDLLRKTFTSQFVFPALGHDDPASKIQLGNMWSRWLPTDSIKTFESDGYYMIDRKDLKLQIIMLNTNLMTRSKHDKEAKKQWDWLNKVLQKCEAHKQTVYLVGHIPPGTNERRGTSFKVYSDYYNKKYLQIVRRYASTIMGQFYGHLHSDTFRIVYDAGSPVSWILMAPSLTPKRTSNGQNNPGLRLYKFDKHSGQVLDYTQYYLDLSKANKDEAGWQVEYNFSGYYGITQITSTNLHSLAEKLTVNLNYDDETFSKYFKANSVKIYNSTPSTCDFSCSHGHYCAIARLDFKEFEDCLETVPSAFSSLAPHKAGPLFAFHIFAVVKLCVL